MEYSSTVEKNEIMKCAGKWMELETIILGEATQIQKDICHVDLIYGVLVVNF